MAFVIEPGEQPIPPFAAKLRACFAEQASSRQLGAHPAPMDDQTTILSQCLYWETRGSRSFKINVAPEAVRMDGFSKQTGVDYEIELLSLFIEMDETLFPQAWQAFERWFYGEASAEEILKDWPFITPAAL